MRPAVRPGTALPEDEALSDVGELILARESDTGSGLFQLDVTWDQDSCTVSPSYDASGTLPEADASMTNAEAVEYFSALPPASLGLSGDTMAAYSVFCEDGQVLLDGVPCLCLNIYQSGRYQASYLFSPGRPADLPAGPDHGTGHTADVLTGCGKAQFSSPFSSAGA